MTTILICITVLLAAAAGAAAAVLVVRERARTRLAVARVEAAARIRTPGPAAAPPRLGYRVTVHIEKPGVDRTIHGVLIGDYADRIVLADAEHVTASGVEPLPGRPRIRTADIAWIDEFDQVVVHQAAPRRHGAQLEAVA